MVKETQSQHAVVLNSVKAVDSLFTFKCWRLWSCDFGKGWINALGICGTALSHWLKVTLLFTPLDGDDAAFFCHFLNILQWSICLIAILSLYTHCACFLIMGVTWSEGSQSLDGGVSVPANFTEDYPVCFRPGASTRRNCHLCGRSLRPLPYLFSDKTILWNLIKSG